MSVIYSINQAETQNQSCKKIFWFRKKGHSVIYISVYLFMPNFIDI